MTEEKNILPVEETTEEADLGETEDVQFQNPTARKVMKWVDFALLLCRLLKSILHKLFLWLEKWESSMESHS